jgi:hypothetical protein
METTRIDPTDRSADNEVLLWRFTELLFAGYATEDAIELAARLDVDLHYAVGLTARGCPPSTAARILL